MKLFISPYHRAVLHATLCTNKHKAFCDNNKFANDLMIDRLKIRVNLYLKPLNFLKNKMRVTF